LPPCGGESLQTDEVAEDVFGRYRST
jgi:hypothetical protein